MSSYKEKILDDILPAVQMPGQYVGAEWNMVRKDPAKVALRFCFAFPDTYAIGMSHSGLHILYGILNQRDDVYVERAFAPWTDMEERLRAERIPLCSLETFTPLREFDAIGFSLQYEMGFTNVLDMLELGGVPLLASDRGPEDPLIVAGGPCAFNPEPLADFIDLFVIGDGEDRINDLADACIELKRSGPVSRIEAICALVNSVPNVYAPALYQVEWLPDGRLKSIAPRSDQDMAVPGQVEPAVVEDLDRAYVPDRPIVPFVEVVHDRISIEIMRGCTRGCRFCHAGMTRRPVRCRSVENVVSLAEKQYASTGHSEIALTSLSSSDHPRLRQLVTQLAARFNNRKVSLSLPSLRVDDQLRELPHLIGQVRKPTLTLAPEAATDRLRNVINKDITEEDLYRGAEAAFRMGWRHIKLYFMVGLPTETDDDVIAIAEIAERVSQLRRRAGKARARVNLSIAPFVPKPHTPFQWEPMASTQRIEEIRSLLRRSIRSRSVVLKFHRPQRSFLEGVFARGDRKLGRLLLEAHRLGCRFDAWDETFHISRWTEAFSRTGISAERYANRPRTRDEVLPWSCVSAGVSEEFLWRERERAMRGELTSDCRGDRCHTCGLTQCPRREQMTEASMTGQLASEKHLRL